MSDNRDWGKEDKQDKSYSGSLPRKQKGAWIDAAEYLMARNLPELLACENGWYVSQEAGDNYQRIVIPATSSAPENHYWQARDITGHASIRYQSPAGVKRGDAVVVVWPENGRVHGAAIVEGPMDALAAAGARFLGIAMMGTHPAHESLLLTSKLIGGILPVTVLADKDAMAAMVNNVLMPLLEISKGIIRLASPDPYKDLAEAPPSERRRLIDPTCS